MPVNSDMEPRTTIETRTGSQEMLTCANQDESFIKIVWKHNNTVIFYCSLMSDCTYNGASANETFDCSLVHANGWLNSTCTIRHVSRRTAGYYTCLLTGYAKLRCDITVITTGKFSNNIIV